MLPKLEKDSNYPYDIFPMTWCMADNTPIDADLPDAVKSWNEEYAYPHIKICTATEIMQTFEKDGEINYLNSKETLLNTGLMVWEAVRKNRRSKSGKRTFSSSRNIMEYAAW